MDIMIKPMPFRPYPRRPWAWRPTKPSPGRAWRSTRTGSAATIWWWG